jgi:hypothetical protein
MGNRRTRPAERTHRATEPVGYNRRDGSPEVRALAAYAAGLGYVLMCGCGRDEIGRDGRCPRCDSECVQLHPDIGPVAGLDALAARGGVLLCGCDAALVAAAFAAQGITDEGTGK